MRVGCKYHPDNIPDTVITTVRDGCLISLFCIECNHLLWEAFSNVIFNTAVTKHGVIDP